MVLVLQIGIFYIRMQIRLLEVLVQHNINQEADLKREENLLMAGVKQTKKYLLSIRTGLKVGQKNGLGF